MHNIYNTDGFVIYSKPYGEADKILAIFTRELGLVYATARGIRLEKSKLRPYVQDYFVGNFGFVRGVEFWRLTDARGLMIVDLSSQNLENAQTDLFIGRAVSMLKARIASLLLRLLNGEEPHSELFDRVLDSMFFLNGCRDMTEDRLKTFESLVVARILHRLGYIGDDIVLDKYTQSIQNSVELLDELASHRVILNKHINKAMRESQL